MIAPVHTLDMIFQNLFTRKLIYALHNFVIRNFVPAPPPYLMGIKIKLLELFCGESNTFY